jgi:murein tripeptide amidase MpaA
VSVYRTAAQLAQFLEGLAFVAHTRCQAFTLAEPSVQGAAVTGLHIHVGEPGGSRHGVLLLGGVHARELMNPEAIVGLAGDLLESYANQTDITYAVPGHGAGATWTAGAIALMLESLDIWLIPCSNPDGHDYVLSTDYMWRKNRRPETGPVCPGGTEPVGVDLNRNCAIAWGIIPPAGEVSCDPCDYQVYCGPEAFSEPEARNLEAFLAAHPIDTFADVHSYSEMILYPWGHAPSQSTDPAENFTTLQTGTCQPIPLGSYREYIDPADLSRLQAVGAQMAADIARVRGHRYQVAQSLGLYPTTGTNPEYAYSRHLADPRAHKTLGWTIETGPAADNFAPADPSQTILDTKAAMLSLLMQSVCAIDVIGTADLESAAAANRDQLAGIRTWRDALGDSDAGRSWLGLWHQAQAPMLGRMAADGQFRARLARLVAMAAALAGDPDSVLGDDHIQEAVSLIDDLAGVSPEHLRPALRAAGELLPALAGLTAEAALAVVAGSPPG